VALNRTYSPATKKKLMTRDMALFTGLRKNITPSAPESAPIANKMKKSNSAIVNHPFLRRKTTAIHQQPLHLKRSVPRGLVYQSLDVKIWYHLILLNHHSSYGQAPSSI